MDGQRIAFANAYYTGEKVRESDQRRPSFGASCERRGEHPGDLNPFNAQPLIVRSQQSHLDEAVHDRGQSLMPAGHTSSFGGGAQNDLMASASGGGSAANARQAPFTFNQ